jgi:hypothetical protein
MQLGLLLNFVEAFPKIAKYSQALGRALAAADSVRLIGFEERLPPQRSDRMEFGRRVGPQCPHHKITRDVQGRW